MNRLSIVVPLYNEARGLPDLARVIEAAGRLLTATSPRRGGVLDDGGHDDTLTVAATRLPASGLDVQVVGLSRNFGKEAALARRSASRKTRTAPCCSWTATAQHPPTLIGSLVGRWLDDGYDVIYTAKAHRDGESAFAPARGSRRSTR